jgi:hypothetical protein
MCGVAKYAEIVAVKILNSEREGTLSDFIKAVNWVIGDAKNHPDKRAVINKTMEDEDRYMLLESISNQALILRLSHMLQ